MIMTQEDKELLLKDLSTRLPYGVIMTNIELCETHYPLTCEDLHDAMYEEDWDDVPYLRPMSSMTDEERKEYWDITSVSNHCAAIDWLNAHHFDYRGLIEKGLAIEAPKGMYD